MTNTPAPGDERFAIAIKTFQAFEPLVAAELRRLGFTDPAEDTRLVTVSGTLEDVYRLNYMMRTALRILIPVRKFIVHSPDDLYRKIKKTDWTPWLSPDSTFAIDPHISSGLFRHPHFASLRMKDAIADQFTERVNRRPDVDPGSPDVRFDLHIDAGNRVTVSLDSSGTSLNQRGYRVSGGEAPLNEVLAAGLLERAGYTGRETLYVPMCGSGTLAIEAAMMTTGAPARLLNPQFGFMKWKDFNPDLWKQVKARCDSSMHAAYAPIMASDLKAAAADECRRNLVRAGMSDHVAVRTEDFFDLKPTGESGMVILNPPYGERMPLAEIQSFYRRIGDQLKRHWAGHTAWLISSNLEALKHIGLKPSAKFKLLNGNLPCLYQQFDLFRGDRKSRLQASGSEADSTP